MTTAVAIRIVIAEDEALIRLDLQETLEEEGYEVVGAVGRGDEAVALVKELSPDLAILDIKMPGMDGIAAAKEIVSARRAAVLILTAFSQRDLVEKATTAGAVGYLVKPFQKSELIPAIEVAIARFKELRALEDEVHSLEDQLVTRRLVDRAKGMLMDSTSCRRARPSRSSSRRRCASGPRCGPSPSRSSTASWSLHRLAEPAAGARGLPAAQRAVR